MKIEKENMTVEDTMDRLIETKDGITCGCGKPRLKIVCIQMEKTFMAIHTVVIVEIQ